MLVDIGPRSIGRCEIRYNECTAKNVNIVKKTLTARGEGIIWTCLKCFQKRAKEDEMIYEMMKERELSKEA